MRFRIAVRHLSACFKIFGGSDSVRRVREAQGLSAAPFSFSSDVPQRQTLPCQRKHQHLALSELIYWLWLRKSVRTSFNVTGHFGWFSQDAWGCRFPIANRQSVCLLTLSDHQGNLHFSRSFGRGEIWPRASAAGRTPKLRLDIGNYCGATGPSGKFGLAK